MDKNDSRKEEKSQVSKFYLVQNKAEIDKYADILESKFIGDKNIKSRREESKRLFIFERPASKNLEKYTLSFALSYEVDIQNQTCFLVKNNEDIYFLARNGRGGGNRRGGGFEIGEVEAFYLSHTKYNCIFLKGKKLALVAQFNSSTFANDFKDSFNEMDDLLQAIRCSKLTLPELEAEAEKLSISDKENYTTRMCRVRTRQEIFRQRVLKTWLKCPFTKISNPDLLIASHIKPYADCDLYECDVVYNGIPMTASYDKLLDQGFISFNPEGKLIISRHLTHEEIEIFKLKEFESKVIIEPFKREKYIEYHRTTILRK